MRSYDGDFLSADGGVGKSLDVNGVNSMGWSKAGVIRDRRKIQEDFNIVCNTSQVMSMNQHHLCAEMHHC